MNNIEIIVQGNNGQAPIIINKNATNEIYAEKGMQYSIVHKENSSMLVENVIALKSGDDLVLHYSDGQQVTLKGFFSANNTSSIRLPSADGEDQIITSEFSALAIEGDLELLYAQGESDVLLAMVENKEVALQEFSDDFSSESGVVDWLAPQYGEIASQSSAGIFTSDAYDFGAAFLATALGGGLLHYLSNKDDSSDSGNPDVTTDEVLLEILEDSASVGGGNNANGTLVTFDQLDSIVKNVDSFYINGYQDAITAETGFSNPPTIEEVQHIIDTVNANSDSILGIYEEVLEDSASEGGSNNSNGVIVTSEQLARIVDNVNHDYEAQYQAAIAEETGFSNPPTEKEVQHIINRVNADNNTVEEILEETLEDSSSPGGGNNANGNSVTTEQLDNIVENVNDDYEDYYQEAIENETDFSNPPTIEEIQDIIDSVNDAKDPIFEEILEDSASLGGGNNSNGISVTEDDLAEIVDNLDPELIEEYQDAIEAETGFSNPPTPDEVQDIIDSVNNEHNTIDEIFAEILEDSASIGGGNNSNDTSVTKEQLNKVVENVNPLYENDYQQAIEAETGFSNPPTTEQVQYIIDTVNASNQAVKDIFAEILEDSSSAGGNSNANDTLVTDEQLSHVVDNINPDYEAFYQEAIEAETNFSNLPTVDEVQALVDSVNERIDSIIDEVLEDSASIGGGNNGNETNVTIDQLDDILEGVNPENEDDYTAAIEAETGFSNPPTIDEIQTVIDEVNAEKNSLDEIFAEILEDSASIGGGNNSNGTPVTKEQLDRIVENVEAEYETDYQDAIAKETDFSNPPTLDEVQTIVDQVNADKDTLEEIFTEILEDSASIGGGNNSNGIPVTKEQLDRIVEGVEAENEADYQDAIAKETGFSNPPTVEEVQNIIDQVNADKNSLDEIFTEILEDSASIGGGNNSNGTPVTKEQLDRIVENVEAEFEAEYQDAIAKETDFSNPPTVEEIQEIIDTVNENQAALDGILAEILEDSSSVGGSNNTNGIAVTTDQLGQIVDNVNPDYQDFYQDAIADETGFSNPPTVEEVQALVDGINDKVDAIITEVLEDSASIGGGNNGNGTNVTLEDLAEITDYIKPEYEDDYLAAIEAETDFSNPPTVDEVQTIIDEVNAEKNSLDEIFAEILEDSASIGGGNNTNGAPVTKEQLDRVVDNVVPKYETAYQDAIAKEDGFSNPPTVEEVQSIIDTVNAEQATVEEILNEVLEDSSSSGGANNNNGTSVTDEQLNVLADNVNPDYETFYQEAIAEETDFSNPPTVAEVQTLIDNVNAKIDSIIDEVLEDSASIGGGNNGNGTNVTLDDLAEITDAVNPDNEADYLAAIEAETGFSNPPTIDEIQTIVDEVNAQNNTLDEIFTEILEDSASIGGGNNSNGTPVTKEQLDRVVDNVEAEYEAQYQEAIAEETDFSNPPTAEEVQKVVDDVNAFQASVASIYTEILEDSASIGGGNNANDVLVTVEQLDLIVNDVNPAFESEYQTAITEETGFSNPPTTAEVQAVIDEVNAHQLFINDILNEILEDSSSPSGGNNSNGILVTTEQLTEVADNVDPSFEADYQAAIQAEKGFDNPPTVSQVQSIIDAVNADKLLIEQIFEEILEDSASIDGGNNSNGISVSVEDIAKVAENVDFDLEAQYQDAIEAETGFSNPPTPSEVQSIVDSVNANQASVDAILAEVLEDSASIAGGNNSNGISVTVEQLDKVADFVDPRYEADYQAAIEETTTFSNPTTVEEVQTIIDSVNANNASLDEILLEVLEDSSSIGGSNNADGESVTKEKLDRIVDNINPLYEEDYQEAIEAEIGFSNPPTVEEVQQVIDAVNDNNANLGEIFLEVLEDSASINGGDNANGIAVSVEQLDRIADNVEAEYESYYQAEIAAETDFSNPPTAAEVQAIIDGVNAAQLEKAAILAEVLEDSVSIGGSYNINGTSVTVDQLDKIVENLVPNYEADYQAAIENENSFSNPPTIEEVQSIIDEVNAANLSVEAIRMEILEDSSSFAGNFNENGTAVTSNQLNKIVHDVNPDYETAYQKAIQDESGFSNLPTIAEIQAVIDSVNAKMDFALTEILEDSASIGGADNANETEVTIEQLAYVADDVKAKYEDYYQDAIAKEEEFSNPPTAAEVQAIIDRVNDNVTAIFAEILEDSASFGGANNSNDLFVTAPQLSQVAENVNADYEENYQEAIAETTTLSNPPTPKEVQAIIDAVNEQLDVIFEEILEDSLSAGGNNNGNGNSVTTDQLEQIVDDVNPDYETQYQEAIEEATDLSNPPTKAEVQELIDDVNDTLDEIFDEILEDSASPGGNNNGNGSSVTTDQLEEIVDDVNPDYETEYQDAIEEATDLSNPPTKGEVQDIIDNINDSLDDILEEILEDSASEGGNNNGNGTSVTTDQLDEVVDNVNPDYEDQYQDAIEAETGFSNPPTKAEVQDIVDDVNNTLDEIFEEILEDSASSGGNSNGNGNSVTTDQLDKIVDNVDPDYETEYQDAIEKETGFSNPPTEAEVQDIIDEVNDTQAKLEAIFSEILEDSASPGGDNNSNGISVNTDQLDEVADNVYPEFEEAYQAAIEAETGFSNPPTESEVQAIIDAVNEAEIDLNAIFDEILEDSASPGGNNNSNGISVNTDQLEQVADDVNPAYEEEYQEAIEAETGFSNPPTEAEVQAIIDEVNNTLDGIFSEILEDSASIGGGNNSNGISVTTDQLEEVANDVNPAYEEKYQEAIEAETGFSNPPTKAEVQAIIDEVNNTLDAIYEEVLEDSASSGGNSNGNGNSVTTDQLDKIVDNVDPDYETEYQDAIEAETGFSNPPTEAEVQDIIDEVNDTQAKLEAIFSEILEDSASPGGDNNSNGISVNTDQLDEVADNVYPEFEEAYQAAIEAETGFSNPPTESEVQAIIDAVNEAESDLSAIFDEILEDSASPGGSNNSNGISVNTDQLEQVADDVNPAYEEEYQEAIEAETGFSNPPTEAEVQAIIDEVNNTLDGIFSEILEDSASIGGGNNSNGISVTTDQLEEVANDVNSAYEEEYQEAIEAETGFSNPPTKPEVQAIIDAVNTEFDVIFNEILEDSSSPGGAGNSNGISVSVEQLQQVADGVNTSPDYVDAYHAAIEAETDFSNPPTAEQVAHIIDTVNMTPNAWLENDTGESAVDAITNDGTVVVNTNNSPWEYSTDFGNTWISGVQNGSTGEFTLTHGSYVEDQVQVRQIIDGITTAPISIAPVEIDTEAAEITSFTLSDDNIVNGDDDLADVSFSGLISGAQNGDTIIVTIDGVDYSTTVNNGAFTGSANLSSVSDGEGIQVEISGSADIAGNEVDVFVDSFDKYTAEPTTTVNSVDSVKTTDTTPVITGSLSTGLASGESVSITLTWTEYIVGVNKAVVETPRTETFSSLTGDVVINGTSWELDLNAIANAGININGSGSVNIDVTGNVVSDLSNLSSTQTFEDKITVFQQLSILDNSSYKAVTDESPLIVGVGGPGTGEVLTVTVKDSAGRVIKTFSSEDGTGDGGININYDTGAWNITDAQWQSSTLSNTGNYTIDAEVTVADGNGGQVAESVDMSFQNPQPREDIVNDRDDTNSKIYAQDDGSYWVFWANNDSGSYRLVAQKFNSDGTTAVEKQDIGDNNSGAVYGDLQANGQTFDVAFRDDGSFVVFYTQSNGTQPYLRNFDANGNQIGDRISIPNIHAYEQTATFVKTDEGFVVMYSSGTVEDYDLYQIRFDDDLNGINTNSSGVPITEAVTDSSNDGYGYVYNANNVAGAAYGSENTGNSRNTDGLGGANLRSIDGNDYYIIAYQTTRDKNDNADLDGDGSTNGDDPNHGFDVYIQVYDHATGEAVSAEVMASEHFGYHQAGIEAIQLNDGSVVLTWMSNHTSDVDGQRGNTWGQQDEWNVYMRRFDIESDGNGGVTLVPLDAEEIMVNSTTDGENGVLFETYNKQHSVTELATGGYVIAWTKSVSDSDINVYAQTFDAFGNKVGSETLISTGLSSPSYNPYVAGLADGGYVVSWTQDTDTNATIDYDQNDDNDIYTTVINSDGSIRLPGDSAISGTGTFFATANDQVLIPDVVDATNAYMLGDFTGVDVTAGISNDYISINNDEFGDIDGGGGVNTLTLVGDFDLNLSNITGSLSNINNIQLNNTDDNLLTLSLEDVLDLTDESFITINGAGGDTLDIDLNADSGWSLLDTVNLSGVDYSIYNHNQNDQTSLWVESTVNVI